MCIFIHVGIPKTVHGIAKTTLAGNPYCRVGSAWLPFGDAAGIVVTDEGGCACSMMSDSCGVGGPLLFELDKATGLAAAMKELGEAIQVPFTFEASWQGEQRLRETITALPTFVDAITGNHLEQQVLYRVDPTSV